jgi:hypothetical protein
MKAQPTRPTPDLSLASSLFGPIQPKLAARIARYCRRPTPDRWDDIQTIILNGETMITVWQAWCAVDPWAPRYGRRTDSAGNVLREWDRIPTVEELTQAIAYATH